MGPWACYWEPAGASGVLGRGGAGGKDLQAAEAGGFKGIQGPHGWRAKSTCHVGCLIIMFYTYTT